MGRKTRLDRTRVDGKRRSGESSRFAERALLIFSQR
jgi:hypothetical protein